MTDISSIAAVTGIVGAVGAYLAGEMTLIEAFQVIWPLITVAFLRKGVADGSQAESQ